MVSLLLLSLFVTLASIFGRFLVGRAITSPSNQPNSNQPNSNQSIVLVPLERLVLSTAIGLGAVAYGVYGLGLMGQLSFWPITCLWGVVGLIGLAGANATLQDLQVLLVDVIRSFQPRAKADTETDGFLVSSLPISLLIKFSAVVLILLFVVVVIASHRAPGPLEWDAISYHLADPKIFLMEHRIYSIPTEHHSSFPFTMEMLFTIGLLYQGYALANLFHLTMALLTVCAMIGFCQRCSFSLAGWLGGVGFLSIPVVLWESSVAYLDLGLALYLTLSAFLLVSAFSDSCSDSVQPSYLHLSAICMGFALGMKYLALIPLGLSALVLIFHLFNRSSKPTVENRRNNLMRLRPVIVYFGLAFLIGCPWYIKNIIINQNPVYPFYYRFFPASRYWSQDRAEAYQSEQDKFGTKPYSIDTRSKILNLVSVPWHLLTQRLPADAHDDKAYLYCNPGEFNFTALYGGLLPAIVFPLAMLRRVDRRVRILLWLAVFQTLAWFQLSQVGRYLIQIMPLYGVVGGYALTVMLGQVRTAHRGSDHDKRSVARFLLPGWLGVGCVFGQAVYVLASVCTLPMPGSRSEYVELMSRGQLPSAVSVPALLSQLDGASSRETLHRRFNAFDAMQYINLHSRPSDKVLLYEEVRGFYLDRPYLWANAQHSSYIPYAQFETGRDFIDWMRVNGYTYMLINLMQSSVAQSAEALASINSSANAVGSAGNGAPSPEDQLFALWTAVPPVDNQSHVDPAIHVRTLIGDAVRGGFLATVFSGHGCLVLEVRSKRDGG